MACRGVHFALTPSETEALLSAADDGKLIEIIQEEIEERWDDEWLFESDKSWDAIHRCLTDGTLDPDGSIRGKCVLGGRDLYQGSDYLVCFLDAVEVGTVARALEPIDNAWMKKQYDSLASTSYDGPIGADDCEYTLDNFNGLKDFFRRAALAGRPVVFSVDQ